MDSAQAKKAHDLIAEANALIKREWDKEMTNDALLACYKANNAVMRALDELSLPSTEREPGEDTAEYVFSRLGESLCCFSEHYQEQPTEALEMVKAFMLNSQ